LAVGRNGTGCGFDVACRSFSFAVDGREAGRFQFENKMPAVKVNGAENAGIGL